MKLTKIINFQLMKKKKKKFKLIKNLKEKYKINYQKIFIKIIIMYKNK